MNDALPGQPLSHAPGGQLVVGGGHQAVGDGLEGFEKAGEIGELIERFGLGKGQRLAVVALAQLGERSRRDGAFEVQVQFGLGQAADECRNVVHG